MSISITKTSQLSVFNIIRSALLSNSTLSQKFSKSNIYDYEPHVKGASFKGFPYIWVNIPTFDSDKVVFDHSVTNKIFVATLVLRVEFCARDKVLDYCNAIISSIEGYESNFQSSGYYDVECELVDVDPNSRIHQKDVVEAIFDIRFHGYVGR